MRAAKWPLLALHAACAGALVLQGEAPTASFDAFVQAFGRSYRAGSSEYAARRKIFEDRAAAAALHNGRADRRWTAGVSHLWDWSEAELVALRGWRRGPRPELGGSTGAGTAARRADLFQMRRKVAPLPSEVSWAHLAAAKLIRNQGACGSCWAIASITVLQAHAEVHTKVNRTFSAQQLVSCVQNPRHCGGEGGCRGATVELAMEWVMDNGCAEDYQVPYAGEDGQCKATPQPVVLAGSVARGVGAASFGMHGWERLPENKYEPLMRALAERGPVAVSAAAPGWTIYSHGVFDGCMQDAIIDHAVVAIGFGTDAAQKYWTIQNSWGPDWGERGTIRLLRRDDEEAHCGIDRKPELGTGCSGGPAEVTVCGMCGVLYDSVVPHFQ